MLLLGDVRPHGPAMQRLVHLPRAHPAPADPAQQASPWDSEMLAQVRRPPLVGSERRSIKHVRPRRAHAHFLLETPDRRRGDLPAAGRLVALGGELRRDDFDRPASLRQLPDPRAELRIAAQIAELDDRAVDDPLGGVAADPLDPHAYLLAAALHVDDHPLHHLADDLLAIGRWVGWGVIVANLTTIARTLAARA